MMMKKNLETKNLMNIACRVMGLLIACQLSFVAVSAQGVNRPDSVYASNMKLGKMFQQCGNTMKARACYETAIKTAYKLDLYSLVNAQLSLVDVIKFQNPVEAQRLNDNCMETSSKYPDCRQRYLALKHRLELKKMDNITIIDDAYNSNPVGSKMALDVP